MLPVTTITKPTTLNCLRNGLLPSGVLRAIGEGGLLEVTAAQAWDALWAAALDAGFALTGPGEGPNGG